MKNRAKVHSQATKVDGAFISRSGRLFHHNADAASELGAAALADADMELPPGIKFTMFHKSLHLVTEGARVKLRRNTGRHLRAALRRLKRKIEWPIDSQKALTTPTLRAAPTNSATATPLTSDAQNS